METDITLFNTLCLVYLFHNAFLKNEILNYCNKMNIITYKQ